MDDTIQVLAVVSFAIILLAIVFAWWTVRPTKREREEDEFLKAQQRLTAETDRMKSERWIIDERRYNMARFVKPEKGKVRIAWIYIMKDMSLKQYETTEKENADVIETEIT